ncbi:hypothetical protein GWK47_055179 [Chionoecetes opilio]|uniref:Uncharacterized protein n=1 Tax=Chionoecetes opilio TaxID=41210 RepID=A0A8J4XZF0_CHIOP|nr:hypothetical protein GWK47_055179 [Chionoecetes opilio]
MERGKSGGHPQKNSKRDPKNYPPNFPFSPLLGNPGVPHHRPKFQPFLDATISSTPSILVQAGKVSCRPAPPFSLLPGTTRWKEEWTPCRALDIAGALDRMWHRGLAPKLRSMGVRGALAAHPGLPPRQDPLKGGDQRPHFQPANPSTPASRRAVPIPEAQAYADDCTLPFPATDVTGRTRCRINLALDNIVTWSSRWQVSLAPDKTQALLISRRQAHPQTACTDIGLRADHSSFRDPSPSLGWSLTRD